MRAVLLWYALSSEGVEAAVVAKSSQILVWDGESSNAFGWRFSVAVAEVPVSIDVRVCPSADFTLPIAIFFSETYARAFRCAGQSG